MTDMSGMSGCPFPHAQVLPDDSTPTNPSPSFAHWRDRDALVPLRYRDGHEGLLVTREAEARAVLTDPRFSQQPQRMPDSDAALVERVAPGEVDAGISEASAVSNVLGMDGPEHLRLRRAITKRFSVRSARARADAIATIVAEELDSFRAVGSPADLMAHYAEPISARVHCLVLGIHEGLVSRFADAYVHGRPRQEQHDLLREAIAHRREHPGEDVISDLIAADLSDAEVLGLINTLSASGRDTVAYFIATGTFALLEHPDQLAVLRAEPELIDDALEEIIRYGTMFLTLFPRTALVDVELGDRVIPAGTTVSVGAVSANRDPRLWGPTADRLDVTRDARGHLGFGDGPHMCVGQQVARVEIATALRHLITALPTLRLVHADQRMPQPLAHPVATYEAGAVVVSW